jgi:AraC-like DNA-binding protein
MKAIFEKRDDLGIVAKRIKNFRGFPPMFHSHMELIYVMDGEISMTIDGQDRVLKKGELSVLFPYVIHSYEDAPYSDAYILIFEPKIIGLFESELNSKIPVCPFLSGAQSFEPLIERITLLTAQKDPVNVKTAFAYLQAVIGELLGKMPLYQIDSAAENMTKPILLYCSEHFADEDIGIKKIASDLYISQSYGSKVFSVKLKYSFREYINELRISKAKELLRKTDMKIVNVMLECGFKNQSSFNRIFSEITGVSPKEYRRLRWAKNDGRRD